MLPCRINRRKGASKREIGASYFFPSQIAEWFFARQAHTSRNRESERDRPGVGTAERRQTIRVNGSRCRLDGGLGNNGKGSNTNCQRKQKSENLLANETGPTKRVIRRGITESKNQKLAKAGRQRVIKALGESQEEHRSGVERALELIV